MISYVCIASIWKSRFLHDSSGTCWLCRRIVVGGFYRERTPRTYIDPRSNAATAASTTNINARPPARLALPPTHYTRTINSARRTRSRSSSSSSSRVCPSPPTRRVLYTHAHTRNVRRRLSSVVAG